MNMLLGSGAESMEDVMLKMMMGLGMSSSHGMCTEGDWVDHPLRNLFLAARRRDAPLVFTLLQQGAEKYDWESTSWMEMVQVCYIFVL